MVTVKVEIDQREVGAQAVVVLGDAAISHLVEAEDPLQDAEHMLHLGPHAGLAPVLLALVLIHIVLERGPLARHVLGLRCGFFDHFGLALIASVAPHLALFA